MTDTVLPPSSEPAIVGRIPTAWLLRNMHRIDPAEFYDERISEGDLKAKYGDAEPPDFPRIDTSGIKTWSRRPYEDKP